MKEVVVIALYTKEKKILLQHRDEHAPVNPSKWGFFGGAVDKDETPLEAVKRECLEELNYALKSPKLIHEEDYPTRHYYVYAEPYDKAKHLDLREGKAMGWFSFDEAKKLSMAIHHFEILKIICRNI